MKRIRIRKFETSQYLQNDITPILKTKHNASVCVNCDIINCCVPEGWGEFEVEGVEFFEGEDEGAESVCLI